MKPEEAIKRIENLIRGREDPRGKTELDFALDMAIEALKEQRPHGEWKQIGEMTYKCTKCGWLKKIGLMPYCENCGADMGYSPSEECKKRGDQVVDWFWQGFNEAMETKEGEKLENDRRGIPGIQEEDEKAE